MHEHSFVPIALIDMRRSQHIRQQLLIASYMLITDLTWHLSLLVGSGIPVSDGAPFVGLLPPTSASVRAIYTLRSTAPPSHVAKA